MQFSWVYITTNKRNGTLYTGVTSDLVDRIWKHKNDWFPGFSRKYGCKRLVWFETHHDINAAIQREKRIKRWRRAWKLRLIEAQNPDWLDLYEDLTNWVPDNASGVSGMTPKETSDVTSSRKAQQSLSGTGTQLVGQSNLVNRFRVGRAATGQGEEVAERGGGALGSHHNQESPIETNLLRQ